MNFGIVYGISSFGLSQDLSISRKEAAEYIESYFATYPQVKAFLDRQVADAKEKGYVTTLYGRRRPGGVFSSRPAEHNPGSQRHKSRGRGDEDCGSPTREKSHMTDKELHRLRRSELLEILIEQKKAFAAA